MILYTGIFLLLLTVTLIQFRFAESFGKVHNITRVVRAGCSVTTQKFTSVFSFQKKTAIVHTQNCEHRTRDAIKHVRCSESRWKMKRARHRWFPSYYTLHAAPLLVLFWCRQLNVIRDSVQQYYRMNINCNYLRRSIYDDTVVVTEYAARCITSARTSYLHFYIIQKRISRATETFLCKQSYTHVRIKKETILHSIKNWIKCIKLLHSKVIEVEKVHLYGTLIS